MLPYKVNDRVNIRFDSGDFIQAMITKIEGEQYLCVALSVGGGYKQGDKLYCTPEQMNRTSRLMSVVSHYVLADRVDFLRENFIKKYIKIQKAKSYKIISDSINTFPNDFPKLRNEQGLIDNKKFEDEWKKQKEQYILEEASDIFDNLADLDTSPNHQYLGWVCKLYLNEKLPEEDFHKTKIYLTELFKLKLAGKVQGFDINTINSIPELYDVIKKDAGLGGFGILGLAQNETEEQILNEHATKVWENENWIVFTPDTYEASCILGEGTSWCTATKDYPNQYKSHTAKGKLWIAINKQNPQLKFQYHFETGQFMNASDRQVNMNQMREEYPDLMEGLFGTVEKHYTSGEGEDSLINYVNYIDKSRGGSVISKEKLLEIIKKNTVVDKKGKSHVNLNFNNETVDFIYKFIPEILTDDLANRFIASKQVTDIDTITDLFENRKSYEDVWEGNPEINFYDTHDPDREGSRDTAIITALLESGKLGKETLLTIIRKQRGSNSIENKHILAIKGRLAKLLTDEEVNKILPEDYQYHNGRPYIMFPEGLWETDVLDDFMSDDFKSAFEYHKKNGFYDIYANFGDSGLSYDDLLNDVSPELSKQIQYYVKYKIENSDDKDEDFNWIDEDINTTIEDFDEVEELKDAMERGWSRAYETGYSDAVWDKIYKSIYGYFDGELKDKNGMVIGVCSDVTDIDDWESLYVGEYGSLIGVMSGEADSKIDADFDYIYGDAYKYLNEEIENAIYEDVKDWEEVIATMPKEKKKKTTKPKTIKPKKVGGILNMNNILSEYLGEKTALDYRMGDEPQLFENTNKGVVFVGGDLMGVNTEGIREPYSIDWLQANKMWAVRQLQGATKLKNLALKGVDVIVFVAYKKLLGGMQSNPAFQNGVDRAIIEKLSEQGLTVDEVVEKIGGEGLSDTQLQSKILKYLGLSKEQIAKDLAMDNYKDYIGKIVGVAKFSGIHTDEHRTIEHQVYPINIILENYTEVNPPLDFEEFAKDSGISNKSLWLRLRSFALTMNVNNNPAISYLYDTADANDHYGDINEKVANKNNIDMNKINKIRAIKEELIDTFDIKGVKKTAKRFPYIFDKHQPQWKFDKITGKMILDEENLEKVGMRKKAISDESKKKYQELSSRLNQLTQQYANGDESVKPEIDKLKTEMDNLYTNGLDKKNSKINTAEDVIKQIKNLFDKGNYGSIMLPDNKRIKLDFGTVNLIIQALNSEHLSDDTKQKIKNQMMSLAGMTKLINILWEHSNFN